MKNLTYFLIGFVGIIAVTGFFYPQEAQRFGGTVVATFQGGTGTTTAPISQLIYGAGTTYRSTPTTTVSCAGGASCTAFVTIGASPITITGSGTAASSTLLGDSNTWTGKNSFSNLVFTGTAPTLGSCGTATITATSTDVRGTIEVSAGTPTTCNLIFSATKSDTPTCVASTNSVTLLSDIAAASTTGVQFGLSAAFSGGIFFHCLL